jgi:hypothetical protein
MALIHGMIRNHILPGIIGSDRMNAKEGTTEGGREVLRLIGVGFLIVWVSSYVGESQ